MEHYTNDADINSFHFVRSNKVENIKSVQFAPIGLIDGKVKGDNVAPSNPNAKSLVWKIEIEIYDDVPVLLQIGF